MNRILVVKLAGIGDLLTAYPALEALRQRYPHAEISALVTPQTELLMRRSGLVDRVIALDKYLFDDAGGFLRPKALLALARLARQLRGHSFDAIVLLHHLVTWSGVAKYALLTVASGVPLSVGLDDGRGRFLKLAYPDQGFGGLHEVDYWLKVVGLLGAIHERPRVKLSWGLQEEGYAAEAWQQLGLGRGEVVAALHPGSGGYSPVRRWDPHGFAVVAGALVEDGLVPLVVAGPGEEDLATQVAAEVGPGVRVLQGAPTPLHLAATLSRCRLFVGNDSGVMHVALASGVPVVAIFGLSNHRAWGPYDPDGEMSRVVRVELPCSPCLYRGQGLGLRYGCGDPQCLKQVAPAMVISAARDLLRATDRLTRPS
ncbi:MAG: glycosyltransferase family 9 protein [Chloroflexota bacterium]